MSARAYNTRLSGARITRWRRWYRAGEHALVPSALPAGVYLVRIQGGGIDHSRRLGPRH